MFLSLLLGYFIIYACAVVDGTDFKGWSLIRMTVCDYDCVLLVNLEPKSFIMHLYHVECEFGMIFFT